MKICFKGKEFEISVEKGTLLDAIKSIEELNKAFENKQLLVARQDKKLFDLTTPLEKFDKNRCVELLTFEDDDAKKVFWHTTSHILAYAIKKLYPKAKPTIGPPIENGFYYDFYDLEIGQEDLAKIEEEMKKIIKAKYKNERIELNFEEAKDLFKDNKFKVELIEEAHDKGEVLSAYAMGDFIDFCRGPQLYDTSYIGAFKLTSISGAYWRGDANREQLTRIYGISFPTKEELKEYLQRLEEAKKRDHRNIGRALDLFSIQEEAPGFIFWHPKGWRIYRALENFIREVQNKYGYLEVRTPFLMSKKLWEISGHWEHYKENMYIVNIEGEEFAIKPMNCPAHILIFKSKVRSYRELPMRISEFGHVHRHELSGTLSGLFRVRSFTQDDSHIFAREDQIKDIIKEVLQIIKEVYSVLGFDYTVNLSTKPEDYMGSDELWEVAERSLKEALEEAGFDFKIKEGEGAFYGPKIDIDVKDSMGRFWQCGTVQLDFQMPIRFNITYMGEDGTTNHRPVMIHRAILGSIERFMGVLIEHFAGKLPLWLSPEQVRIIAISEKHQGYAKEIKELLEREGFYVSLTEPTSSVSKRVREAQMDKVNYAVVVGDKEVKERAVTIRARDNKFQITIPLERFVNGLKKELESKALESKKEFFG